MPKKSRRPSPPPPPTYASLADYLKATGTTHGALALRLRVSRSYVTLLAAGDRQPSLDLAIEIERLTGVPLASMVSEAA